ncbi:hypothetical protein CASFOL_003445 [Castilleja foliolosa]|uniref:Uncharacterized protein n=1 Tax=Castilleja foliolosa TaxID=1961234 RepID=A0ABD3EL32_9LAMI
MNEQGTFSLFCSTSSACVQFSRLTMQSRSSTKGLGF